MRRTNKARILGVTLAVGTLGGIGLGAVGVEAVSAAASPLGGPARGFVYTTTNAVGGSNGEVFARQGDGALVPAGT